MIWWILTRIVRLTFIMSVFGTVVLGGVALYTQYAFQESFYATWSRLLKPQIAWQKGKYPSVRPLFTVMESLLAKSDPRDLFGPLPGNPTAMQPAQWRSKTVGPQRTTDFRAPVRVGIDPPLTTARDIRAAIDKALPGTVLTVAPGEYLFNRPSIAVRPSGTPDRPITLRAARFGTVTLRFNILEGLHVQGAHWIFENLIIEGVCENHRSCEHAFHIVGQARQVVVRNNWVTDFNSPIKVNGSPKGYPDGGKIIGNAFVNRTARQTDRPVTFLDIVAANGWAIERNFIADFAKALGNRTSYAAFYKGGGSNNVFEGNLVRCEWRHRGGIRIGLSFGGGGSDAGSCRDRQCNPEHTGGIMRSNIVMDCPNDVGVYLNKSTATTIHNNLFLNTRGIDVRFADTDATIFNNVIDGRILGRDDAKYVENDNVISTFDAVLDRRVTDGIYAAPTAGDLRLADPGTILGKGIPAPGPAKDFCGNPYPANRGVMGPFQYGPGIGCTPSMP